MSLLRLLSLGHSLKGLKGEPSRYKLSEQNLLPKFAAVAALAPQNNTIVPQPTTAESSPASVSAPVSSLGSSPGLVTPCSAPVSGASSIQPPAVPTRSMQSNPASAVAAFPLKATPQRSRSLWSEASRSGQLGVQPELALEAVKVLRNDLSDADLELVPIRAEVKAAQASMLHPAAPDDKRSHQPWTRLTRRLIAASRARS